MKISTVIITQISLTVALYILSELFTFSKWYVWIPFYVPYTIWGLAITYIYFEKRRNRIKARDASKN